MRVQKSQERARVRRRVRQLVRAVELRKTRPPDPDAIDGRWSLIGLGFQRGGYLRRLLRKAGL